MFVLNSEDMKKERRQNTSALYDFCWALIHYDKPCVVGARVW